MATTPQDGRIEVADERATARERSVGEHIFIWIAWALAAAFWGATMTSFLGILRTISQPAPGVLGGGDVGGAGFLLMGLAGFLLLGAALAYGSMMSARRDRSLDSVTEARTAGLYDVLERQGGEDLTSRSPNPDRRAQDFR